MLARYRRVFVWKMLTMLRVAVWRLS